MAEYAFVNKQVVPLADAKVGIMTHALHYGTACFEGLRGNWNSDKEQLYIFRIRDHFSRLHRSCRVMKIDLPYSVEELCKLTIDLAQKNGYREDVYIRPLAYKSSESIGVKLHDLQDDLLIFIAPFGDYLDITNGIRCGVSSWRRLDDNMIPPRAKIAGSYVNSALAKTEAHEHGYDEAILLNQDGHVCEGSGENIFLVQGDKLITPLPSDNILVGITRDTVIKLAKSELGIDTVERQIGRAELYTSDECFLTGNAARVAPVIEIDHRKVGIGGIGRITKELQRLHLEVVRGESSKYMDWCNPVY